MISILTVPGSWFLIPWPTERTLGLLGEMANSRIGSGKVQEELEISSASNARKCSKADGDISSQFEGDVIDRIDGIAVIISIDYNP